MAKKANKIHSTVTFDPYGSWRDQMKPAKKKENPIMRNVANFRKDVRATEGLYGDRAQERAAAKFEQLQEDAFNEYIPKEFRKDQNRALNLARKYANQRWKGVGAKKRQGK